MISGHEKNLRTPLKRVRGLGSAREGVGHWWQTRLVSLAIIPLTIWFLTRIHFIDATCAFFPCGFSGPPSIPQPPDNFFHIFRNWLSSPVDAFLLILLTILQFHHAASGMQAVFEDYIHKEGRKLLAIYGVKAICLVLGGACVFSILRIAFGHP